MAAHVYEWIGHPLDPRRMKKGRRILGGMLQPRAFRADPDGRWRQIPHTLIDHEVNKNDEGEMLIIPPESPAKLVNGDMSGEGKYPALYIYPDENVKREWVEVDIVFNTEERTPVQASIPVRRFRVALTAFLVKKEGLRNGSDTKRREFRIGRIERIRDTNSYIARVSILTDMRLPSEICIEELV